MLQGIAKKTCDVLFMLSGFHSAVIDVGDFGSGVRDHARLLGRDPAWQEWDPDSGLRSAFFPVANMCLEIREARGGKAGLGGIRLVCDDRERFGRHLESGGLEVGPARSCRAEGPDGRGIRSWISTRLDRAASRGIPIEWISQESDLPVGDEAGAGFHGDPAESGRIPAPPVWDGAPAAPESAIRALDHVVIFSADPEVTRALYSRLGIRLALDRTFEERGLRLIFFRIGGVTIEIGGRLDGPPEAGRDDRFGGLAWQVVDLEAIHSRLVGEGFDVSAIRQGHKPGTRVCTVRDPVHGVPTLLIEPVFPAR